jgi:hypothetical protein
MEEVFLRKYSLTIGRAAELIVEVVPGNLITPGGEESTPPVGSFFNLPDGSYTDFITVPSTSINISDLRIKANVVDSKAGTSNKQGTTIEVFNLSPSNQKFIRVDDTVLLKAGYEIDGSELPLIYVGQVTKVTTEKKGQDTITKILCQAASVARKNIKFSKVPARNETSETIAKYYAGVAAKNGIPTGNVFVAIPKDYPSGFSAAGNLFESMEEFCKKTNLQAYVTLGKLYIEPIDSTPATTALIVKPENVKGAIRPEDDASGKTSKQDSKGIKFSVFLDGRITAAKVVNISFGEYKGDYKVISVQFKMDYEGKNWDTIVSCQRRS